MSLTPSVRNRYCLTVNPRGPSPKFHDDPGILEHAASVVINPRVVWHSEQLATFVEGCLSFNTVAVAVRRPVAVHVQGFDVYGNQVEFECEDFSASLMQHEIDHLDAILTLHRADRAERRRALTALLSGTTGNSLLAA